MKTVENQTFGEERALYGSKNLVVENCAFDGEEDGESALKESKNIIVKQAFCNLRYPFWHDKNIKIYATEMTEKCRAALWYSSDVLVSETKMHGIKALRECKNITVSDCDIVSVEFGWKNKNVSMKNVTASGEYFMFQTEKIEAEELRLNGKYSFQYIKNSHFNNCVFNTKDAFWHGKNIVVENSVINGEYLAWYSDGLTLINCKINGTQPFCYCRNLKLINCVMENCDLCFEKSDTEAEITTSFISIKNPKSGSITVYCDNEIDILNEKGNCIIQRKEVQHI